MKKLITATLMTLCLSSVFATTVNCQIGSACMCPFNMKMFGFTQKTMQTGSGTVVYISSITCV